jgi:RHS repeat-associated protein
MRHVALMWVFAALSLLAVSAHAADTVYYYSSDVVHSEVVVTDAGRNVVERTYYAPYGQVLNRDLRDGPGYGGHEEDPETNLVYMQQRYYDPEAGRFLSTDPVQADGGGGSFNRYEYAQDNPYRYTDPDGRCGGPTCDQMVQNYGAWANANPEAADKLGSTAGVAGVTAMLAATGAPEAGGLVAVGRYVVGRIAGAVTRQAADDAGEASGKTYTTYTRAKTDGTVYSGRTSGTKTPEQQVAARTSQPDHQAKTAEGYGPAKVDRNSSNPDAIRGREQQLIEQHGGAQSQGGASGNKINGVSPSNPKANSYKAACTKEFGCG